MPVASSSVFQSVSSVLGKIGPIGKVVAVWLILCGGRDRAAAAGPSGEWTVVEGAAAGTEVGRLAATRNADGTAHYEIVSGDSAGAFTVDQETGRLSVLNSNALDYERQSRYELRVRISRNQSDDSARRRFAVDLLESGSSERDVAELLSGAEEQTIVVQLEDAAEAPVLSARDITLVWSADSAAGSTVSGLQASDPDAAGSLHYEILAGDPDGLLEIEAETGRLAIRTDARPAAGRTRLPVTIRVTDATGLSDAATMSVELVGLVEPTVVAESASEPETPINVAAAATTSPPAIPDAESHLQPGSEKVTAPGPTADSPSAASDTAPEMADEAVSQSGLINRFLPVLTMFIAAIVAALLLRRRQRKAAKRFSKRDGADVLARPLPGWLSGAPQLPRPPVVVAISEVTLPQRMEAGRDEEAVNQADDRTLLEAAPAIAPAEPDEPNEQPVLAVADETGPEFSQNPVFQEAVPESTAVPGGHDVDSTDRKCDVSAQSEGFADPVDALQSGYRLTEHDVRDEADFEALSSPSEFFDASTREEQEDNSETYSLSEVGEPVPSSGTESLDEGSYVGGWTQDDAPFEESEVSAVQEATDALQESDSPLGLDPRVAALRAQLSNLFGVSLDPAQHEAAPEQAEADSEHSPDEEAAIAEPIPAARQTFDEAASLAVEPECALPVSQPIDEAAPSNESDPVQSWLAYLKSRNAPAVPAVATAPAPLTPPAAAALPATPVAAAAPVKLNEPLIRQNKSAVRIEISHLRDIANRHTRSVLAVKATEQKARLVWFLSGASMVVLCFVSMMLLKSPTAIARWCGWALLCGAAMNLAVCINSFQKLKSQTDSDNPDPALPPNQPPAPASTSETDPDMMTPEMQERLEGLMESESVAQAPEVHV